MRTSIQHKTAVYYNNLNLLRGLAAFMVCLFHFTNYKGAHGQLFDEHFFMRQMGYYGYLGVFVFFVLSGFIIPLSLYNSNFTFKKTPRFLLKRYLRIEIPYLVSIAMVLLVAFIFARANSQTFTVDADRVLSHIVYTVPFTGHEWYNEVYWTLGIEMQFYLVMAFVFFGIKQKNVSPALLVALCLPGLIWHNNSVITMYMPFFTAGMAYYLFLIEKCAWPIFLLLVAFSTGCALYLFHWYEALMIPLTLGAFLYMPKWEKRKFYLGKISYSLYLTHGIIGGHVIYFMLNPALNLVTRLFIFSGAMLASILFAWIFYQTIEKPSMQLSKKIMV